MKILNLKETVLKLNTPSIISLLQSIEFNRGRVFTLPKKLKLNRLHDLNKRRSVTSSNEIEGIKIAKRREEDIFINNLDPETKEEYLLNGYNNALENIFSIYKYQALTESYIKDLHYFLYKDITPDFGGKYKSSQNYIREYDKHGLLKRTVFIPSKPEEVTDLMGNLIYQYNECMCDPTCNRILTIFVFILDFLCIHPFDDGNGRVSRLLTTFLLLKNGYDLDEYYSLSYVILNNIDAYYHSLEKSSISWKENKNDYEPFVHFMLVCLKEGYEKLAYIFDINSSSKNTDDKILQLINDSTEFVSKGDIEEILFSLSKTTIEKSLTSLVKDHKIQKIQNGRYAKYYKTGL